MITCSSLGQALLLFLAVKLLANTVHCKETSKNERHKREWLIPAKKLIENVDYTKEDFIAQIGSDLGGKLRYSLKGPGADKPPYNLFVVDEKTGKVRITDVLDRENVPQYDLVGVAWYKNNTIAENDISLPFVVVDQNDNPPVFITPEPANVYEGSPAGTAVTCINATDADEPGTPHSEIVFGIIKQEPHGKQYFAIDKDTGCITVKDSSLDREAQNSYILTVKGTDMGGAASGNTATATIRIHVLDINDNVPTLEKDEYAVSVDENVVDVEVLRIQALDKDEERTDNWLAVFEIVSGNGDGYFNIETDPNTNEGVLYLVKPVDYEAVSDLNLNVAVANKAPPGAAAGTGSGSGGGAGGGAGDGWGAGTGTGGGTGTGFGIGTGGGPGGAGRPGTVVSGGQAIKGKTYLLKVKVNNRPDGPKYGPNPKLVPVSENPKGSTIPRVIATYPAMDGDTGKEAANVRYAKGYDPANWLSIDENTAEIKLNKMPDRESPHVINGTYYAKILCITDDLPAQTATGTIALQVEDLNDNCPTLLSKVQRVCSDAPEVNVTAEDADAHPNGAPLQFLLIPEETQGKWQMKRTSDAAAALLPQEGLWPGSYKVTMEIKDQQGMACPDKQVLHIVVCTCSEEGTCSLLESQTGNSAAVKTAATTSLGAAGMGFLLLGFLILLSVLGLLLTCSCGTAGGSLPKYFADIPFDTKEYLIPYHTEGRGEDREVPLLAIPISAIKSEIAMVQSNNVTSSMAVNTNFKTPDYDYQQMDTMGMIYSTSKEDNYQYLGENDMALSDVFLEQYFTKKARYEAEHATLNECLLVYNYEGQGSSASSVNAEDLIETFEDLEFLNGLGPKFSTLAQICGFTCPELEPSSASTDMATHVTCERSTDHLSSSHMLKTAENITAESPPASVLVSENTSIQDHVLVVQEPLYYMVEQAPSTVLLTRQASVGLGQSMYLVNGVAGAEGLILQQNYSTEGTLSGDQQDIVSGDSEKSAIIKPSTRKRKSIMRQANVGWMHQGSFSGEAGSEGIVVTNGHSVDGHAPGLTSAVVGHTSGFNNGTLLNGEHVVVMENATGPGQVVLGEKMNGLNQSLVQNVSPTHQNLIMVQGQLAPTQLTPGGAKTFQMGLQGLNHREVVLVNESERDRITLLENPGQVLVGSQAGQAQLQPVIVSTLQRGAGGMNHGKVVLGTSEQVMKRTNTFTLVEGLGQGQVENQVKSRVA
ncbi:desmoglein-2.1-like [Salminus brasiliensis]|uniref:desmoglein-2.1-like n=1 Tax=Salminus brasiliensis TaxID=930266 RepID=UPI003B8311A9